MRPSGRFKIIIMEKKFLEELRDLLKKYDIEIYASMYELVVFKDRKTEKTFPDSERIETDAVTHETIEDILKDYE